MISYKGGLGLLAVAVSLAFNSSAETNGADKKLFGLKFQTNQPLVYSVSVRSKTVTTSTAAGKTTQQQSNLDLRYQVRCTYSGVTSNGEAIIYFEPFNFEEDAENNNNSRVVTKIRGLKIKTTQN